MSLSDLASLFLNHPYLQLLDILFQLSIDAFWTLLAWAIGALLAGLMYSIVVSNLSEAVHRQAQPHPWIAILGGAALSFAVFTLSISSRWSTALKEYIHREWPTVLADNGDMTVGTRSLARDLARAYPEYATDAQHQAKLMKALRSEARDQAIRVIRNEHPWLARQLRSHTRNHLSPCWRCPK